MEKKLMNNEIKVNEKIADMCNKNGKVLLIMEIFLISIYARMAYTYWKCLLPKDFIFVLNTFLKMLSMLSKNMFR